MHFNLKHSKAHSRCWLPCHNYVGVWASEQLCASACVLMALSIYENQRFWNFNNSSFWTFRAQRSSHKIRSACACVWVCVVAVDVRFLLPAFFCLLQRCLLHRFSSSFIFISSVFWLLIIFISRLFLTDASIRPLWNGLLFTWPNHKSYRAHPPQLFIHLRISRIMRSENIKSINNFW